ncbi:VOC family protein [Aliiglaciecola sp. CAU 1673]|uniref:VOC family protein n=1 Tax=Aliiglaciecola sp. CAU 1673 TaxID=3032595 RepID=UPI0023DAA986|nr:VOC family protein [Aliiglaciecola sp. CAU 1673]MDF2180134.1 VOC family protein [Aliiglaciecola sp. CAU 1673]
MNLNQITLPVNDMQAAVDFYLKLGMTQIVDTPHYARFSCPEGDSTFSLSLQAEPVQSSAVIYFESEQLDQQVSELTKRGIAFDQIPQDMPYLWREAVLHDPSGNKIKLFYAGENRHNPPWRVTNRR